MHLCGVHLLIVATNESSLWLPTRAHEAAFNCVRIQTGTVTLVCACCRVYELRYFNIADNAEEDDEA